MRQNQKNNPITKIKLKQCRALIHLHFCQQAASAVLGEGPAISASYHTAEQQEADAFDDGGMASSSASSSKGEDGLMDLLNDVLPQASGSYGGAPCHGHGPDHAPELSSAPDEPKPSDSWLFNGNEDMPQYVEDFMRMIGELD